MEGGDLCMSNIEERIVRMTFDNATFANNVSSTMSQLQALNKALKLEGASQGLNEVGSSLNKFDTSSAQGMVSALASKFGALQIAAITALSNIVNRAVDAGLSVLKSLSIDPIMDGFSEYENQLGSIQTILANTGLSGAAGLAKVNDALNDLNKYSDQTIYNFQQMTQNIGTFTAAGVSLDTATQAIKGIANLAAISGSNAQQASTAMYQLSQALAAGKVTLEDWNSVVNAGMGGKVFQDALLQTARVHGVAVDSIIKKEGSFRNSLQKGWLTGQILTETLSKFTGELTDDQLKSMGYTKEQIKGIQEMAKTAVDAATKVKTMSQLMDTLREAVGSGWAQAWQIVFGNFDEAKDLFTGVNNTLGQMIQNSFKAFNGLLQGWKDLGGRQAVIDGIVNGFNALMAVLKPIKDAFREIFPAATAKDLVALSTAFRDFMSRLKIGETTANNLRRTFAGFFAILGIGWDLIKAGAKFIGDLIGKLSSGSGGFLQFTARVGDFLVSLRQAIQQGNAFARIFGAFEKILAVPIALFKSLSTILGELFKNADKGAAGVQDSVGGMVKAISPLQKIGQELASVWHNVENILAKIAAKIASLTTEFVKWAHGVGQAIAGVFKGGLDFSTIFEAVGTGLFATLVLALRKFIKNIGSMLKDGGGLFSGVKEAIEGLTGVLKGMQNALNAGALLGIAIAVGVLTLALIGLSHIDAAGLTRGSAAIAGLFIQLGAAFFAFNKITSTGSALKIGVMAAGLILLAAAIDVLAIAVAKLGAMRFSELVKGLTAVGVLLGELVVVTRLIDAAAPGMIRSGVALTLLGVAVRVLVFSVQELAKMDWEALAKGLTGVGALLVSLALFTKFADADKGGVLQGAGIILLATGLRILAAAVNDFSKFNWIDMARGMAGVAVGLGLMTAAMNLLPTGSVFKAAGVVIVAAALHLIASAVKEMSGLQWEEIGKGLTVMGGALSAITTALALLPEGSILSAAAILVTAAALEIVQNALAKMANMSWEQIGKGLVTLAGSLIIIAGALVVMDGTIAGSFALLVAAGALAVLTPILLTLGGMDLWSIVKAFIALAGAFVIIGLAGLVLTPLVPALLGLGAAILLLGAGAALAGLGVLAFATAISVLAVVGAAGVAVVVGLVVALVALIPYVATQLGLGIIAFATVIATAGPAIFQAMKAVMEAFLDAVLEVIPKIVDTILQLIIKILTALANAVPQMVQKGADIIVGFLRGIANNLGAVISAGTDIIVAYLEGIGRNFPRVVQAGVDLIINFINGIANAVRANSGRMGDAGANLAEALVQGAVNGLAAFGGRIGAKLLSLAQDAWNAVTKFFDVNSPSRKMIGLMASVVEGVPVGIDRYGHRAVNAMVGLGSDMVDGMAKTLTGLSAALDSDLVDFQPTIAPVLDLSQVKKEAASLADILAMPTFTVGATDSSAQNANATFENNRKPPSDGTDDSSGSGGNTTTFTQNNYSPKALSNTEIYRQTKNLVSTTKGG
jgi:tape measure domain-containing protein